MRKAIFTGCGVLVMLTFLFPGTAFSQMTLEPIVSSVFKVTDIANCGDDRLFIMEQAGKIKISDLSGNLNPAPFLSITGKVNDSGGEQGLLGLAFSPNYITDRRFYVNYTNNSGNTVISRFTATSLNPDVADSLNEEILFTVVQPYTNHNGGGMQFGPDGYLYISLGDGGGAGDPIGNGQSLQTRLGKILRIDVSADSGYQVPASNPFVGVANADSAIWSFGLRNAWRFSFDKLTGDKWIADVGQNLWEEINFQPASSTGGENYGWRCYEGMAAYNLSGCQPFSAYVAPVYVYGHFPPCSVTGGFVYRGAKYASWFGKYFFTDYCSGIIQSLAPNDTGGYDLETHGSFGAYVFTTFGQDRFGELYIGKGTSGVLQLSDSSCLPVAFISESDTIVHNGSSLQLQTPYHPGFAYQWYFNDILLNGATGNRYNAHVSGNYKVRVTNDSGCVNISSPVMVFLNPVSGFLIFPNPAGDFTEINWSMNFPGNKILEVFDATGRSCEKTELDKNITRYKLDTYRFTKGVYIIRIIYDNKSFYGKFLVR